MSSSVHTTSRACGDAKPAEAGEHRAGRGDDEASTRSAEPASRSGRISVDERTIRVAARRYGPRGPLIWIFLRRLGEEVRLRFLKRLDFRRARNEEAVQAYDGMGGDDLAAVNVLQAWAGWRTIPRNLDGRLPDRPVFAIDLCCGIGDSTAVLAYYCPPGSRVLGLEHNPRFVERAERRAYPNRLGGEVQVEFHAQSVLESFCDARGRSIPDQSVGLINASGAIGCHFDPTDVSRIARECDRVLSPGGLAMLDSGREGVDRRALAQIFAARGFSLIHEARSCTWDRRPQLCLKKASKPRTPPSDHPASAGAQAGGLEKT